MKKQVVFGVIALSLLSLLFSANFGSAFWSELGDGNFVGAFNSLKFFTQGIDTGWSAQVLLFFLVFIVIFAVSDYLPFFSQRSFLSAIFSLIVSILAIFYLNPVQISSILFSYKTLGLVLTAIIPFFVIAAISKKSFDKGHFIISKILWLAFIILLLAMVVNASVNPTLEGAYSDDLTAAKWTYWITILAAIAMLLWEKALYFMLAKGEAKDGLTKADLLAMTELTAKIEELKDSQVHADPTTSDKLQKRIDDLTAKLRKYQKA